MYIIQKYNKRNIQDVFKANLEIRGNILHSREKKATEDST
jgi:hypothetical protein